MFKFSINSLLIVILSIFQTSELALAETVDGISSTRANPSIGGLGPIEYPNRQISQGYSGGLFFEYATNPVTATDKISGETLDMANQSQRAIALLQYAWASRLSAEITVPYGIQQERSSESQAFSTTHPQQNSLGDINFKGKYGLLQRPSFSIGAEPFLSLPTGDPEILGGDGVAAYGSNLTLGGQRSRWQWAVQGGFIYRPEEAVMTDPRIDSIYLGSQYSGGIAFGYQTSYNLSLETGVLAVIPADSDIKYDMTRWAEFSLKARAALRGELTLDSQIALGLGYGVGVPEYRITVGIVWQPARNYEPASLRAPPRTPALESSWYEMRPQDLAADQDVRKDANKIKTYDQEGEKSQSFGFSTP